MKTDASWSSAFAPATVANVGPGLDVLGLALSIDTGIGDYCAVRLCDSFETNLTIVGDDGRLPTDPNQNVASVVGMKVLELAGVKSGFDMQLKKGIPPESGLGSSAASAACAAVAMNRALGEVLSNMQLIEAARVGEQLAAGSPHPDNVVPAILGGFQLMMDHPDRGLETVQLPAPSNMFVVVVQPAMGLKTSDSRAVLPSQVSMSDAVANMGSLAMVVSALYDSDMERLSANLVDRLHQPYRSSLIKGYNAVIDAALESGALGAGLSGSGPSMFSLAMGLDTAQRCANAMQLAFDGVGVQSRKFVSAIGNKGTLQSPN